MAARDRSRIRRGRRGLAPGRVERGFGERLRITRPVEVAASSANGGAAAALPRRRLVDRRSFSAIGNPVSRIGLEAGGRSSGRRRFALGREILSLGPRRWSRRAAARPRRLCGPCGRPMARPSRSLVLRSGHSRSSGTSVRGDSVRKRPHSEPGGSAGRAGGDLRWVRLGGRSGS